MRENGRQWKKGGQEQIQYFSHETCNMKQQHENFVVAVTKREMLAATNQMQGENERPWKKVNENTYDISSILNVTKKFLEVSRCSRAKQRHKKYTKKVCCRCKVVVTALHYTILYFVWVPIDINESFAFSLG